MEKKKLNCEVCYTSVLVSEGGEGERKGRRSGEEEWERRGEKEARKRRKGSEEEEKKKQEGKRKIRRKE